MVALAQVVAWIAVCGEPCRPVTVDLPAGRMFDQVMEIAHQRHLQWLFSYPEVDPETPVPALRGTFTVSEALQHVLQHTPYTFEFDVSLPDQSKFFWISRLRWCGVAQHGEFPVPPCRPLWQVSR